MANLYENFDNISVDGFTGTWYIIDNEKYYGQDIFLLEHEEYGDETASIIVNKNGELILDDVWNGFDDYAESNIYEMSVVLARVLTQSQYEMVQVGWGAFASNPMKFIDSVVVDMVNKYIDEEL